MEPNPPQNLRAKIFTIFQQAPIKYKLLLGFSLILVIVGITLLVYQQTTTPTNPFQQETKVTKLTSELLRAAPKVKQATTEEEKIAATKELIAIAKERKEEALEQIKTDPQEFLAHVLPQEVVQKLPEEIQSLTEKQVILEGTLNVIHQDYAEEEKTSNTYSLITENKTYSVYFSENPGLNMPEKVQVNGVALADNLVLKSRKDIQSISSVLSISNEEKALVVLFNFRDNPRIPFTKEEVESKMLGDQNSVKAYFREATGGRSNFNADIFGWYTLDMDTPSICPGRIEDVLSNAIMRTGNNPAVTILKYQNVPKIFIFPTHADCSLGGYTKWVGRWTDIIFANGVNVLSAYVHELGHAYELGHAASINCKSKPIDHYSQCEALEYGDNFDLMGPARRDVTFLPNLGHNIELGNTPQYETITTNVTRTIAPLHQSSGVRGLVIPKPDTNESYLVEYRYPLTTNSFDQALPDNIKHGVQIRIFGGTGGASPWPAEWTKLVDVNPETNTRDDAALADNVSFYDSINGITIRQREHDSNGVTVDVSFGQGGCILIPPIVEIEPQSRTGAPGDIVSYTLSVTSKDTSSCPTRTFNTRLFSPHQNTITGFPNSISLLPGRSKNIPLSLSLPPVRNDAYSFGITLVDALNNLSSVSVSAQYIVYSDLPTNCDRNPSITLVPGIHAVTAGSNAEYRLTITNNNDPSCQNTQFTLGDIQSLPSSFTWNYRDTFGGTITTKTIEVVPSNSVQVKVVITSPTTAQNGDYQFGTSIFNNSNELTRASTTGTFRISSEPITPQCTLQPNSVLYDCSNDKKCYNDYDVDFDACELIPRSNPPYNEHFHCDVVFTQCRGRGTGWVGTSGCGLATNLTNQTSEEYECTNGRRCWNDYYRSEDTQCVWTEKTPHFHCIPDPNCDSNRLFSLTVSLDGNIYDDQEFTAGEEIVINGKLFYDDPTRTDEVCVNTQTDIVFTFDGEEIGQSAPCEAFTYEIPEDEYAGSHTITASFAGEGDLPAVTDNQTFQIDGPTSCTPLIQHFCPGEGCKLIGQSCNFVATPQPTSAISQITVTNTNTISSTCNDQGYHVVEIGWTSITGATRYSVSRGGLVVNNNVSGTTYTDYSAPPGTYAYLVGAYNGSTQLATGQVNIVVPPCSGGGGLISLGDYVDLVVGTITQTSTNSVGASRQVTIATVVDNIVSNKCIFNATSGNVIQASINIYPGGFTSGVATDSRLTSVNPPNCQIENGIVRGGESLGISGSLTVPQAGTYTAVVCADPNNNVFEINETNNCKIHTFTTGPTPTPAAACRQSGQSCFINASTQTSNCCAGLSCSAGICRSGNTGSSVGSFPITATPYCDGATPRVKIDFGFAGYGEIWGNRTEMSSGQPSTSHSLLLFRNFYFPPGVILQPNPISVDDPIGAPSGYISCINQVCSDVGMNLPDTEDAHYPYFKSMVNGEWRHTYVNIFNDALKPNTQYLYTVRTPLFDGGSALVTTPDCGGTSGQIGTQSLSQGTDTISLSENELTQLFNQVKSEKEGNVGAPIETTVPNPTAIVSPTPTPQTGQCAFFQFFCLETNQCQLIGTSCNPPTTGTTIENETGPLTLPTRQPTETSTGPTVPPFIVDEVTPTPAQKQLVRIEVDGQEIWPNNASGITLDLRARTVYAVTIIYKDEQGVEQSTVKALTFIRNTPTVTPTDIILTPTDILNSPTPVMCIPNQFDANGDGQINIFDINVWEQERDAVANGTPILPYKTDFNCDGLITLADYSRLRARIGTQVSPTP